MYFKAIRYLSNPKLTYELIARYLPALLFSIALEICLFLKLNLWHSLPVLDMLKIPLVIIATIFLALIPKFISTSITSYAQTAYWNKTGNSTIKYIQNSRKKLYLSLLQLFETTDELMQDMLKATRADSKLQSKNIIYGFFRNFSFLAFAFLLINWQYFDFYVIETTIVVLVSTSCLYISSQNYAEQIIQSYIQIKNIN